MITIVASTNRTDNKTEIVAGHYQKLLIEKGVEAQTFSLHSLPNDFITSEMYGTRSSDFAKEVTQYFENADKFVFIIPEYNGSYPGILKVLIDGLHPRYFKGKKAGLIGISDGHAGNLRGLEHLTGVLHHMRMMVHYSQPKLSEIDKTMDDDKQIIDPRTLKLLNEHADFIVNF